MCRNALYMIRNVIFVVNAMIIALIKHKLCDNCFECLEEPTEDYAKITIDAILMDERNKKREGREELKSIFLLTP